MSHLPKKMPDSNKNLHFSHLYFKSSKCKSWWK